MKSIRIITFIFLIPLIYSQEINVQLIGVYNDSTALSPVVELYVSSDSSDIGGFQFQTTGGVLLNAFGGLADEAGFTSSLSPDGIVLSFSFTGNTIPSGEGTLINLEYSSFTNPELCLTTPVFSDPSGISMDVDSGECIPTGVVPLTPTITILTPTDGETLSQDFINVSVSNSDPDAGYHYHAYIDGNMEGMYYNDNFQITGLSWGAHELQVILADTGHDECMDSNCSDEVTFTLNEPVPEFATLFIGAINPNEQTVEIYLNNSGEVGGVQFNVSGVNVTSMSGGISEVYDFTNQTQNNVVLSFTLSGDWIQPGEELFTVLSFDEVSGEQLCLSGAIVSNQWGDEIPVTIDECVDIPDPMNEYYIVDLDQTGVTQLLEFNEGITGLEPGDEIGIFDFNGIIVTTDTCSQIQTDTLLVGSGIWSTGGASIVATGSVNTCDFGGYATAGFILGNPIVIRIYRPSTEMEYETLVTVGTGSASFSELFSIITEIELIGNENQLPVAVLAETQVDTVVRGEEFTLDGTGSYDNDGSVVFYDWFLNGVDLIGTGETFTHSMDAVGTFTIMLVVTDNNGGTGSALAGIMVVNQPPAPFSLLSPANGVVITVDNSNIDTGMINYIWESSADADSIDTVIYQLTVWDSEFTTLLDTLISSTEYSIGFDWNAFDLMDGQQSEFGWMVSATDGYDEAGSAEWDFTIDATTLGLDGKVTAEFVLQQNYPNPFNPVTEIGFNVTQSGLVDISVYDISGKHVITLVNRSLKTGSHFIQWNGSDQFGINVPSGLYIYRLKTSEGTLQKNMVLIK